MEAYDSVRMTDSTPAFDPNAMDPEERAWESFVSPHFRRKDLGSRRDSRADHRSLRRQVTGWQIDIADRLMKTEEHAGFAVLAIVASYFEMIGKHLEGYEGVGKSRYHFRKGFDSVFREVDEAARNRISAHLRGCAQRHVSRRDHDGEDRTVALDGGRILYETPGLDGTVEIVLNPELLTSAIRVHFAAYVAALLAESDSDLRVAFLRRQGWAEAHPAAEEAPDAEETDNELERASDEPDEPEPDA